MDKPYYISLLNAAELLGSAHQRPQRFSVTTILPKSSVSPTKNNLLVWNYRNKMPSEFLLTRNSETGTIYYSNAELTAVDLVQYEQHIGGLSRAATILEELSELIDFFEDFRIFVCIHLFSGNSAAWIHFRCSAARRTTSQ